MRRALVRSVPASYAQLYGPEGDPHFLPRAREQHASYVAALRGAGLIVSELPADEAHPDCHFVEDPAVVIGDSALLCRLGRDDRRGEEAPVADALASMGLSVVSMEPPATLEGGDVLQLADRVVVGRSARTNDEGIAALRRFCEARGLPLTVVPVTRCLHLKTACTAFRPDGVLVATDLLPDLRPTLALPGVELPGVEILETPKGEHYAANCLALGDRVLLPAAHLKTAALLEDQGLAVSLLPMDTFRRGDGALTCLSILF